MLQTKKVWSGWSLRSREKAISDIRHRKSEVGSQPLRAVVSPSRKP